MKKVLSLIVVVLVAISAYIYLRIDSERSVEIAENNMSMYSNNALGFEFEYRVGPKGYVIQKMATTTSSQELLHSIVLIHTDDVDTIQNRSEGPATITVDVFKNLKKEQPKNWVYSHLPESSANLIIGSTTELVVGGANAVKYMSDGLYASEKIVIARGGNIYLFSGSFITEDSDIRRDFTSLIASLRFIERSGDALSSKINISEVCNGALMYMTFENNKAVDEFIAECIDGKHPEVIERYKNSLNVDGAAI